MTAIIQKQQNIEKNYSIMLFGFIGIMISILVCIGVFKSSRQLAQHNFENIAHTSSFRIQLELKQYLHALEAIRSFFASSNQVDRNEFHSFVTPILQRLPEIQALEWVPRITKHERTAFLRTASSEFGIDFTITEASSDKGLIPAGDRPTYYPVFYLEPLSGNETVLGFDLGSNSQRLNSLEAARDTGQLTASEKITLVQNKEGGVIVFTPVYKTKITSDSPDDSQQHAGNLQGFILGVFSIDAIFNSALKNEPLQDTGLIVRDLTAIQKDKLLFSNNIVSTQSPGFINSASALFNYRSVIDFAGRQWEINYCSKPDYLLAKHYWQAWLTLVIGLLITAWLVQYIRSYQKQNWNIRTQVNVKTRELKNTALTLEKLHQITTNKAFTLDERIRHILELGLQHFQLSLAIVSNIEHDKYTVLHVCCDDDSLPAGTVFELKDTYCAVTMKADSPIGFHNTESKRRYILPFEDKFSINTYIGTPITVNDKRFGTLNFTMPQARPVPFSEEDYSVMNIFAQWIGGEISRDMANKEISHQKDLFESVFRDTPEPMLLVDLTRRILKVNPAFTAEFGYQEADVLGKSTSILYENLDTFLQQGLILFNQNHERLSETYEINYQRKNHEVFPAESIFSALTDADHNVFAYLTHIRNISQRKEAELNLRRQARRALLLHQGTNIAHETSSFLESLQRCIDLVCDILEWPVAHVYIPDNEQSNLLPSNIWHLEDRLRHADFMKAIDNSIINKGEGLFGRIWETGTALWMENFSDHAATQRLAGENIPFKGAVGFPIYVDHEIVAILGFFTYESMPADYDLLKVLQVLGEQVGRVFEKRRAEKVIANAEQHVRLILESAGDGLFGLDLEGNTTFVNPAAEHMTGYSADELVGKSMHALIHHSYADGTAYPNELCSMHSAFTDGETRHVEDEVLWRKDGSCFPVEYTSTPMWKDGSIVGAVVTFHDISERQKIDRMKREFISTVSHELRTPLTSILGSLGLIAGGATGEIGDKTKQLVDIAKNNSDRLLLLINDLLDMEKIASGKMHFDLKQTDLVKLLEQSIESNYNYARQHEVYFQLSASDESFIAKVDTNRFMQVMSNLLSNAAKFSPPGKAVTINISRNNGKIRIAVSDQGPGIPSAFHDKIFNKFSQADASDTRKKGGTGLGLHITRELVQHMRGSISFATDPATGTTFYVDLPDDSQQVPLPAAQHYR